MEIKAIIMDIDGTLANEAKTINPRTRDALLAAQEAGIMLILASGRPLTGMYEFGEALQMDQFGGLYVSYNGANVCDAKTGEVYFSNPISTREGKAVLEHLKSFDVIPLIDREYDMFVSDANGGTVEFPVGQKLDVIALESRVGRYTVSEQKDLAAFLDFPLNKIIVAGNPDHLAAQHEAIMAPFENTLSGMFTAPFYFEFNAKNVDKAQAIEAVLPLLGIETENVIFFGDGYNDLGLMTFAGCSVAMGNAPDDVKAAADEVTLSNEHDGIAATLLSYLPHLFKRKNETR